MDWALDRSILWNAAEAAEKRRDAKICLEYELALPYELDAAARRTLAQAFAQEVVTRFGVAADIALHSPHRRGDGRNHHAHVLTTTRVVGTEGLGLKTRALDAPTTSGPLVDGLRKLWASQVNDALKRADSAAQVDHRSYARQGDGWQAGQHLGSGATALERSGVPTRIGTVNRAAAAHNARLGPTMAEQCAALDREIDRARRREQSEARMAAARDHLGLGREAPAPASRSVSSARQANSAMPAQALAPLGTRTGRPTPSWNRTVTPSPGQVRRAPQPRQSEPPYEGIQIASAETRPPVETASIAPAGAVPAFEAARSAEALNEVRPAARGIPSALSNPVPARPQLVATVGADGILRFTEPVAAQAAPPSQPAVTPPAAPTRRVDTPIPAMTEAQQILANTRTVQEHKGGEQRPDFLHDGISFLHGAISALQASRAAQVPHQAPVARPTPARQAGDAAAAPTISAAPYTSTEAATLLRAGGQIMVDREGLARITNLRPAMGETPADHRLFFDLLSAGVVHCRQHEDSATGATSSWYRAADLVALLVWAGRVAADAWVPRLGAAAARGRGAGRAMDAVVGQATAGTETGRPSSIPASTPSAPAHSAPAQRHAAPAVTIAGQARAGTGREARNDQLRRQLLLEVCDVIHIDAAGKAWIEPAPDRRPTLRLLTFSRVHEGLAKTDKAGGTGLHGLGAALAAIGVPARIVPRTDDLIAVLVDVGALAAALARLTQAEVEFWLARLRHAAQQYKNLHRSRTTPGKDRGPGLD